MELRALRIKVTSFVPKVNNSMNVFIFLNLLILSGCSFLAKNHHRNQLLKSYASKHEYERPLAEVVSSVEKFCNKIRDNEVTQSKPNALLGTNGFLYKGKVYHSWRKVILEAFGVTIKKDMAPIMPCSVLESGDNEVQLIGVNHLYKIREIKKDKIKIEVKKLHPSFIDDSQISSVKIQLENSSYHGKIKKMIDLDTSIIKASRDLDFEWDLLSEIDHEARKEYVSMAYELVDKKWEERARNESN